MVSPDTTLPENLSDWMSTQRWYGAKGTSPLLERIGGWEVYSDDVVVSTHYLLDHTDGRAALYQVPLTTRSTPLTGVEPIAAVDGRFTSDAPYDPVYAAVLLRMIFGEGVSGAGASVSFVRPTAARAGGGGLAVGAREGRNAVAGDSAMVIGSSGSSPAIT